jgi:hypothetical protein
MDVENVLMKFDYMNEDDICTSVTVLKGGKVIAKDFTDKIMLRAFGKLTDLVEFKHVISLFESRCVPENRCEIESILKGNNYSPIWIIRNYNHGVMATDTSWIRFDDEKDLDWSTVSKILH